MPDALLLDAANCFLPVFKFPDADHELPLNTSVPVILSYPPHDTALVDEPKPLFCCTAVFSAGPVDHEDPSYVSNLVVGAGLTSEPAAKAVFSVRPPLAPF